MPTNPREPLITKDINPYASPLGVGGYDDRPPPRIGVWRDGGLLVMHKDAELPRFCIHTGEPAVGGRDYELVWKVPGQVFTRQQNVLIPLCRRCIQDYQMLRRRSFLGLGAAALSIWPIIAFPALPVAMQSQPYLLSAGALFLSVTGAALWLHAVWTLGRPLSVSHAWGDHLWLRDVHRDYLTRLPEWKGGA